MSTFPRSIWLSIATIGVMLGLQMVIPDGLSSGQSSTAPPPVAAPGATAGTPVTLAVDFVGTAAIELTQFDDKQARTTVLIRNDSDRDARVKLLTFLIDRRSWSFPWNESAEVTVNKRSTLPVSLTVPLPVEGSGWWPDNRLPARGNVVLRVEDPSATGVTTKSRDLILNQKQPSPAEWIVTALGLTAALIVLIYGVAMSGNSNVTPTASTPAWTPDSWSTNLAIGGALVTSLVGVTTLPAQTHYAAKAVYTTLSVFFAALVVLAPAVYGLLKVDKAPSPERALQIFAFASAITVWATVGQLGTAALLFVELSDARLVSGLAARAAAVVALIVGVLVVIYAVRAINSYLKPTAPKPGAPVPPPAPAPPLRLL